jgi:ribosomal protein S18 acetylase RimI-like enzyme
MANHEIRSARRDDAQAIAGLLGELGYPASAGEVRSRLDRLLGHSDRDVLVTESAGELVGVAAYQVITLLERSRYHCRLTTLAVRSDHRRRGIARKLVAAVESAAREADCFRLEVTTQVRRKEALAFYEANGFTQRPHRLVKMLDS